MLLLASTGHCATYVWTNTAGGVWGASSNWDPNGIPGSSDSAIITNVGTYTVTLNTGPTVGSLTLGGSSGQQTLATAANSLTINGASVVNASGVLALNGGTLNDNGGLNVAGRIIWTGGTLGTANVALNIGTNGTLVLDGAGGSSYDLGQPLGNAGTVQLVSGDLQINYGYDGSFVNLPGGVVELTADNIFIVQYGGGPGFVNQGTLVKSGGTGTSTISANSFNNSGTVEANTGTININSSVTTLTTGSLFIGAGQTTFSGGTVTMNGSMISSNAVLTGGTFQGNGTLYGVLTWTGGQLGNADQALTIAANAVLVLDGAANSTYNMGQPLSNEGTIYLQSGNFQIDWGNWGSLTNLPGGVVDFASDVSIQYSGGPGFVNQGTLVKSGGTGTRPLILSATAALWRPTPARSISTAARRL